MIDMDTTNYLDVIIFLSVHDCRDTKLIEEKLSIFDNVSIKNNKKKLSNNWNYQIKYKNCCSLSDCILDFLKRTELTPAKCEWLKTQGSCSVSVSLISDLGSFGDEISTECLIKLSQLNIPLGISIFSWGGCVVEEPQT